MQKNYTFIGDHAKEYGVPRAVILHTIIYLVLKHRKMKINLYEGKHWVFNSATKWQYFFPFLNKDQIYRHIKALVKRGVLLESSYNKRGYDKTLWHTLSDALLNEVLRDGYWKKRIAKMQDVRCKNATPIPYSYNTDIDNVMEGVDIF